jgi:hypothetical protein
MKLLEQCRQVLRLKDYSYRTEQSYLAWIVRFIRHHRIRRPNTMGALAVERFFFVPRRLLSRLAVEAPPRAAQGTRPLARWLA